LVQYVTPGDAGESAAEKEAKSAAKKATREVVARFARHDCSFLRVIPPPDTNDNSVVDADPNIDIADNSIIDIGHEALIRRWDKLEGQGEENWIHDEQEDAEQYRALLRYADAWKIGGPNGGLTVFGRNGTPGIKQTISKRFVRFLHGAAPRQLARSKNSVGMNRA
jgi:hypothetical protein